MGVTVPLAEGERLLDEFRADRMAYVKSHLIMAVLGGAVAGLVLVWMGNPDPWIGPVAAILALGARGWYLASEALAAVWRLTDRRLIGPGGRQIGLAEMETVRPFFGDVQVVTRSGDKHLLKYLADPADAVARITDAKNGKRKPRR
ncbi:hypothetical protein E7811_05270 [Aliigemmobacter aestuarii]|uniref:DUF304 domain-containing protein n=2 Tax=Aliigemmobacter aestuarii TaxID=1445661 RepID=A0A4S3MTD1_9RHOB|nr:hypothetical protein E7811_05270 [Gemmobacter aestuarii]